MGCLPLENIIQKGDNIEYPKIIDYACGAGHFLTEGFESVNDCMKRINPSAENSSSWVENKIYGIEKDYRLARVSKISLFMHGAGEGNIIFGDGLENYKEKNIIPNTFDILVANPPYSVSAFKPHLKLKENSFEIISKISNNGSEIETLFVERIAQLVKPQGIAAVVLPSSILNKESESFIAARESIFKNFYIRAIAQLGNKTFGATGTNTVILFLEKYNEPPKRIDMVDDSVESIFENRSLVGWEDEDILQGYLKKIDVDISIYKKYIKRELDYTEWEKISYFSQYYMAFIASSECITKEKQKNFLKASKEDRLVWYNQHFYDFVDNIEVEKLTYFALCYRQNTLIITAPDDNKEQERFLGYKWSNRKGQEGIQVINPGGMLYNEKDRTDFNKISGVIRNVFNQNQCEIKGLEDYYYYLNLQDMLDFSGVVFNKSIRTTRMRDVLLKTGMTSYKLSSNDFDISIGNRVLSTEIVEDGEFPVFSANVFEEFGRINKQNITDFSKPSIIWGIDGDWMVNYIPANKPFYPTDHCGVLRINTNEILPQYMAIALQVEGEYERFSRSNRASTQRIKNLNIQIPEKKVQQSIVDEVSRIDEKIRKEEMTITSLSEDIKSKFVEMFGTLEKPVKEFNRATLKELCDKITDGKHGGCTQEEGTERYFVGAREIYDDEVHYDTAPEINVDEFEKDYKRCNIEIGDFLIVNTGATIGKSAIATDLRTEHTLLQKSVALLKVKRDLLNPVFLKWCYRVNTNMYMVESASAQPNLLLSKINATEIYVPDIVMQNQFADFVHQVDKLKFDANVRKEELLKQRDMLINKHFRQ